MAYELRDFSQTAVDTAISATIINTDTTITIDATTGWPTGGANGPFFAMIDYDVAGKELVLVTSRTGNTLQNVARGQGGTSAAGHNSGAKIRHVHTARDSDEANYAVSQTVGTVTTKGDLLAATAANALGRRSVGTDNQVLIADAAQATGMRWGLLAATSLANDSVGAAQLANLSVDTGAIIDGSVTTAKIADGTILVGDFNANIYALAAAITDINPDEAAAAGVATTVARGDHQHAITAGTPSSVGTANSEGAGTGFARDNHVHGINVPTVRANMSGTQNILNSTQTAVQFAGADSFDVGPMHDPATLNTRLTVPAGQGGVYDFGVDNIGWEANNNGIRDLGLRINGVTTVAFQRDEATQNTNSFPPSMSTSYKLAAGDFIEAIVSQTSGGTIAVSGASLWACYRTAG